MSEMKIIFNDDTKTGRIGYRDYVCLYSYEMENDLIAVYKISVFDVVKDIIDNYIRYGQYFTIYKFFIVEFAIKKDREISFNIYLDKSKFEHGPLA